MDTSNQPFPFASLHENSIFEMEKIPLREIYDQDAHPKNIIITIIH